MKTRLMRKFVYFAYNFPSNFIEKCWEDDPHMMNHLSSKFMGIYDRVGSKACMLEFFVQLDSANQAKLEYWIEANYNGEIGNEEEQGETISYYEVVMPDGWANVSSFNPQKHGGRTGLLQSIDDANIVIEELTSSPSERDREYWKSIADRCKVVKVTTHKEPIIG